MRIKSKAAVLKAGALGVTCALLSAAFPVAVAQEQSRPDKVLDRPLHGNAAIQALGDKLPEVAAQNRQTADELVSLLRTDPTMWLDRTGQLHVKESHLPSPAPSGTKQEAPFPNDQTFKLHSKPDAPRVIHLDFDGHAVTGTSWNASYGVSTNPQPAFDVDGNPSSWSQSEHDAIQSVYQRVAEDFGPFNVDVTTENPGDAALHRTDSSDESYGTRVLITPSAEAHDKMCGGCGGIAYVGIFDYVGNTYYHPAWVFPHKLSNNSKYIAEAASHEAGHNLGLWHDGTSTAGYYTGHRNWAPIMGVGYYEPLVQWSRGEYGDANNTEDDFAVMQSYGLPLRGDDHGSTTGSASALGSATSASGVIETRTDQDVFSISRACSGNTTIGLATAPVSPNLDGQLRLLDASGAVVAQHNPLSGESTYDIATGLSASITANLNAGTYYIEVDGVGAVDAVNGYSDYGALGRYDLAISACAPTEYALSVTKSGAGAGAVTSQPSGIDCGTTCSANFASGTSVTLTAAPASGSTFGGWNGACTGSATTCTVSMSAAKSVGAAFNTESTVFQESSPGVAFNGWDATADAAANGGSYRSSKVVGDFALHKFTGTSVTWLTRKGPFQGIATVSIDGVNKGTVDLYATGVQSFSKTFTGLASTTHTIKVTVTGKNTASQGTNVMVDGFQAGTTLHQDTSPRIAYNKWNGVTARAASGGAYRVATTSRSTSTLRFTGTSVDWITAMGPTAGKAQVFIDGADKGVVDLYKSTQTWKVAKTYSGLTSGTHTIQVKALGTKNASATGSKVVVDGFTVRP